MGIHFQVNSTSAIFPCLLTPVTPMSSRFATGIVIKGFSEPLHRRRVCEWSRHRKESEERSNTVGARGLACTPKMSGNPAMALDNRYSGERYSLFDRRRCVGRNCCGALNSSEAAIRSVARRRVRKSRGEQAVRSNILVSSCEPVSCAWFRRFTKSPLRHGQIQPEMGLRLRYQLLSDFDQRPVIVNKRERLCGRKGREVICPSNSGAQRPGSDRSNADNDHQE